MLAEAVFPFYIIHQTIIVVVGWYLLQAGVAALPAFDPARRDRAGMLAFLCDRAQHRLAAAADRIAAQGGEGVMGDLKGILAIVGVAMMIVGGLWALKGCDRIRWRGESWS